MSSNKEEDIILYTAPTPNGRKISIMLEELEIPYTVYSIDFLKNEQKSDWFIKINPNGRIPAIVDKSIKVQGVHGEGFAVFESGAILIYLAEKYGKFLPKDALKRSEVIQWLMFQMSGLGPMQGQLNVFYRYAPEKIPYAIDRYTKECYRLYGILEKQLEGKDYILGEEITIADFSIFPWIKIHEWAGLSLDNADHR